MARRRAQVAEEVLHQVAELVNRDIEFPTDCVVTMIRCALDDDLKNATIHVGVIPEGKRGTVKRILDAARGSIQYKIIRTIPMQFVPEIHFDFTPPPELTPEEREFNDLMGIVE